MQTCYPISHPVRSAVPTFEPISLDEAKQQLGLLGNGAHDGYLASLITFAREQVEKDAMLVCATGTFTTKRTEFGYGDYFELPSSLKPISSLTSIVYTATDGTATTWSSSQYALDTSPAIPIVKLNYGYIWPTIRGDINGITITVVAGYATALVIPQRVKQAVVLKLQEEWHTRMGEAKEADLAMKCYERIIDQLRAEVYA
jgi:uncharacterized phiE125 gp8 family phage protein